MTIGMFSGVGGNIVIDFYDTDGVRKGREMRLICGRCIRSCSKEGSMISMGRTIVDRARKFRDALVENHFTLLEFIFVCMVLAWIVLENVPKDAVRNLAQLLGM